MGTPFQITIDCADPSALAEFWVNALGFTFVDPPAGFSTWEEWLKAAGVPEEEWDPGRRPYNKIVDPEGGSLRIWFQKVPEPKTVKNRLHLDLRASADPGAPLVQRKKQVDAEAARLVALGAHRRAEHEVEDHYHLVMQDPEGNEFCLT